MHECCTYRFTINEAGVLRDDDTLLMLPDVEFTAELIARQYLADREEELGLPLGDVVHTEFVDDFGGLIPAVVLSYMFHNTFGLRPPYLCLCGLRHMAVA